MKRINTIILMVLLLAMGLGTAKAQVVDVCAGNDTVELRLGNYKYGYVQWQVSEDNEVWSDIDGAIDTVYRFLPDRPRYYRAEVRFPACSEYNYHSQVSYVQIPPKAIAGPDLTIPAGMVARMNATHVDGADGEWNIIEGTGGLLENPNDSRSPFFGEEGEYKLTWTLTNSCGSNTDTVSIKCVRMEYQTDLVIVDETDAILSDSTQRLNGEYIISFNDPVPDIHEGSVLMGYVYPSFLRKVVSFEREGNLFTMQTEQGVLTDVIASGAINIDLTADSVSGRKPHVKYLDRFPTRKELKENPFLLRDGSVYVIKSVSNEKGIDDFEFEVGITSDGYLSFNLLEFDFKKLSNKLDGLKYSSEIRIYPNFNANIVIENLEFKEARIGFYDARVEHIQRINLRKPLSTTLVNKEGCFNKTQILLGGFLIGYIPTLVVLDIPYEFKVEASLNPPMSFTKVTGNTYTYEMYYTPEMTIPAQRNEKGKPYQRTSYETPVGSIDASFKTGFKASVLLLDVLGPYFEVTGDFNPSICASSETGDIGGNINMGVNLSLGCRLQLFSNQLTLSDRKILDFRVVDYNEPAPKRVVKYRGDNQVYSFGQYLSTPIGVRVDGWFNTSMPLAYVHFDPEHGSVSDSIVFTDINGVAETRWKPGVQYGMDKLRVKVYDCYGNLAGQTPQTFRAYSSATDPCINANLTVEAYEVNENTIIPQVSGGSKPYRYSTDGENYSTTQPTIHTQPGHNYHLCVRDKNGCEADTWYNSPFYDCNNTTLQVNAMVVGNSVTVSGRGGIEPYQYSIGGDFQPSGLFGSLYDGEYTVTVRDALGCERSQHVVISRPGKLDISITEITNGWGNAMVMTETSTLIDRGICWSTHHSPTVQDLHNSYGAGGGFYTFNITALDPEKTYYVRAYALDGSGTSYSREVCINPTIGGNLPRVAGTGVTNVGQTTAVGSGNVTYEGGSQVTERGICWSMIYPTIASSHVSCGVGTGAFTADITGLIPNSTYYARAYATNSYGTAYGEQVEFTTPQNGGGGHALLDYSFNNYQTGSKIAQTIGSPWTTWSGTLGGTEDGVFEVKGGSMACHFTHGNDQVVDLGSYSTGVYDLEFDIYVPYGKNGYCALLHHFFGINSVWSVQIYLHATHDGNTATHSPGHGTVHAGSNNTCDLPCVYDEWMHFRIHVDADNDIAQLFFNGQLMCEWRWSLDSFGDNIMDRVLGAMDFYPPIDDASSDFYLDNLKLIRNSSGGNQEHEYVDLGLPSGTLWATCNVGANAPEEYGGYYSWGETQYKGSYDWSAYKYCKGSKSTLTKYCNDSEYGYNGFTDDLTILQSSDDVATVNWGNDWRMPTKEEWLELYYNTTITWTTQNGSKGRLFTASNGNTLFLPAAGCYSDGWNYGAGIECYYWSSSFDVGYYPYKVNCILFSLDHDFAFMSTERCKGCSVRPVRSTRK